MLGILTLAGITNHVNPAYAAGIATGLTISPGVQQISIAADEQDHNVNFSLTNNRDAPLLVNLNTADFNTLDESGGLFFVGTNPSALQAKYGLNKWIILDQKSVILQPKKTFVVHAKILNQPDLAPGGHYGALLVSINNPQAASKKISIRPIASSLLFVTKVGGDTHRLDLLSVKTTHNPFSAPTAVSLRFRNSGNSAITPRGVAVISKGKTQIYAKGIINQNSSLILPETNRVYSVSLDKLSNYFVPGRYKLTINYRFDGFSGFRVYQQSFLVYSSSFLALMLATFLLIIILVKRRRYVVLMLKKAWAYRKK